MATKKILQNIDIMRPPRKLFEIQHPNDALFHDHQKIHTSHAVLKLNRGIYLMEDWWREQHLEVRYDINSYNQYYLDGIDAIKDYTRKFHEIIAPQQKLSHKTLIFGIGATQLLHAAIYALSVIHAHRSKSRGFLRPSTLYFTHQIPGYLDTEGLIKAFNELSVKWIPFREHGMINGKDLVEFVTSPNNPNGKILQPATQAQHIDNHKAHEYMDWLSARLKERWRRVKPALEAQGIAVLNNSGPSVWTQAKTNAKVFLQEKYNIIATYGPEYGADETYARLNLLCTSGQFAELLWRLQHPIK